MLDLRRGGRVVMQQPAKLSSLGMPGFESQSLRENCETGCSVARSSRLLWEQEVAGSNPATPTKSLTEILLKIYFHKKSKENFSKSIAF